MNWHWLRERRRAHDEAIQAYLATNNSIFETICFMIDYRNELRLFDPPMRKPAVLSRSFVRSYLEDELNRARDALADALLNPVTDEELH